MVMIRPATIDDASRIAKIWYDGWRDGHLGHVPDELLVVRTEESFYERAPQRVADTVVAQSDALIDDHTVGRVDSHAAEGTVGRGDSHAAEGTVGRVDGQAVGSLIGFVMVVADEVEQVYVASDQRGTGVAALLLDEATRLVQEHGHQRAWLAVVAGNARARRFYERNGWIDEGPFDYVAASASGPIHVPCHRYVKDLD